MRCGHSFKEAIVSAMKDSIIEYMGIRLDADGWCKKLGIGKVAFANRVKKTDMDEMFLPNRQDPRFTYEGVHHESYVWCRLLNISKGEFQRRIVMNLPMDKIYEVNNDN